MKKITSMIPFMDSEDLYDLALEIIDGEIDCPLETLFPFMDEDDLAKLTKKMIESKVKIDYTAIAPFMDESDVYALAMDALKREVEFSLAELLPFMDEDDVDKICEQIINNPDKNYNITLEELYPFASEDAVDKLFLHSARNGKFYESAIPFVSDECLHQFVVDYCKNPNEDINLDAIYPFLESKDLALLLKTYLKNRKKQ